MSGIMNMFVATKTTIATAVDAFFNSVSLLLNTSSTNGAQNNTFLDSSSNNFTITRNGNTTQGTFTPFSQTGWSNFFDGSTAYLTTPTNAALAYGSGDFTFETFLYTASNASANSRLLGNWAGSWSANFWSLHSNHSSYVNKYSFFVYNYNSSSAMLVSTSDVPLNQWVHIAITRSGNTWRMFINGVLDVSQTSSVSIDGGSTDDMFIGGTGQAGEYSNGYMSNVRIVKGTAVYTSAFTPSTTPLTAISGTSLLTCQSNRFVDNSTNAFAITVNGTPSVQAFSPFLPTTAYDAAVVGGSGYFDGTGDYLNTASSSNLALGTGDFTYECWVYATSTPSDVGIYESRSSGNTGTVDGFTLTAFSGSVIRIFSNGVLIASSGTSYINTWCHVAVTRVSGTFNLYINGVSQGTSATSRNLTNTDAIIGAGRYGSTSAVTAYFPGYIAGVRLVKGTAVYTANFTPPTAPPTAITNTQLLLNHTNAGIFDSAAKNVLETVGNAQVSTTQAKWGTTSMYFDGTGDWLIAPNGRNYINGTEPFTIECWVYVTGTPSYWSICGAASGTLVLTIQNLTTININPYGSGNTLSATTSLSINTWTHIAATRDSANRFDIWVNGVSAGNATSSQSFGSPTYYAIGAADSGGTQSFTGYIDDLRISKFCRYTTTFTPPTAALPTQ